MLILAEREPGIALTGRSRDERSKASLLGHVTRDRIMFQEFYWPDLDEVREDQKRLCEYRYDRRNHAHIIWSQYPLVLDPVLNASCGRGVGKTATTRLRGLQDCIVYSMVRPCFFMLIDGAMRKHYWNPLSIALGRNGHPIFRAMVDRMDAQTQQIWFTNGSLLSFVTQGQPGTSDSAPTGVQGHRASAMYFDEAQQAGPVFMREAAGTVAALDPFDPQHQSRRGAALRYTGVLTQNIDAPFCINERDPNSQFRRLAKGPTGKEYRRNWVWKISKLSCPWVTRAMHEDLAAGYGCDLEHGVFTSKYWQDVWGLAARTQSRLYPDELRLPCSHLDPEWKHPRVTMQQWMKHSEFESETESAATWTSSSWDWLREQIPRPKPVWSYVLGCDPGSDVTSIAITARNPETLRLHWLANVMLANWGGKSDFAQCTVLWFLAGHYLPVAIGSDATGWGHNFCGPLRDDARLRGRCEDLLREYPYGSKIVTRYVINPLSVAATTSPTNWMRLQDEKQPAYENVEVFSYTQIRRLLEMKRLVLPSVRQADDIHRQMGDVQQVFREGETQSKKPHYLPEHVHFVSGLQMAVTAFHQWELEGSRDMEQKGFDMGDPGLGFGGFSGLPPLW